MVDCVHIREEYFQERSEYIKMLDSGNYEKQSHRSYLFVGIMFEGNHFYIPLRNNLGAPIRRFGKIGYAVPSQKRPMAGLDYRYMLIVNEEKYVEKHEVLRIPEAQQNILNNSIETIKKEAEEYISGFVLKAKKGRTSSEAKYRESSLINFLNELGIQVKREDQCSTRNPQS